MNLSIDSYKKVAKWTDEINEKTGDPKDFPSKIAYARAFIKNSFDFVVKNFNYDYNLRKFLDQFPAEIRTKKYFEKTSLERVIQEKVGVCIQFASVLCILTANDQSTLQKIKIPVYPAILICNVKLEDGTFDGHALNSYNFYGNRVFCDPTTQMSFKNYSFLLKNKEELQEQYKTATSFYISGFADNVEIKERNLEKACDIVSDFNFRANTTTKTYRATTLVFK